MTQRPSIQLEAARLRIDARIINQVKSRAFRGANELRNASQEILRGSRGGRRYRVPGTKTYYTASAPGEPPAVRTGAFRGGWEREAEILSESDKTVSVKMQIRNDIRCPNGHLLGEYLEYGTSRMAPRPHHQKIQDKARPNITKILKEPYF